MSASSRVPKYSRSKEKDRPDRAYVWIDGKKVWLGRYGSWLDFVEAWDKVQYPKGAATMTAILKKAMAREAPKCANQFENPKLRQLVAICRELQQQSEGDSFFLSCRMAANLVDVEFQKTSQWLRVLPKFKILALVNQGQLAGRKASEYRYIGD